MKLEAVTIAVGYSDFLSSSILWNKNIFDRGDWVVVTTPEDKEVQRVCRYHNVRHVQTDNIRSRWGEFHKAKGINAGLSHLSLDGWALHFDADMVLPPSTRDLLERADLDSSYIYGCDRFIVPGFDAWQRFCAMPPLQQDNYHVHLEGPFKLAPRFAGERMGGYSPPGFFQLWHPQATNIDSYPEEHNSAAKTDVQFSSKVLRNRRALIPEFIA